MAKGFARVLIFASFIALAFEISHGRTLLGQVTHKLDWRAPNAMEMTVNLGDKVVISWGPGPETGIVQMDYPGLCVGGNPSTPYKKFLGVKASGTTSKAYKGKVSLIPTIGGSIFLTSSVKGQCDAKWLRINVNTPIGR